MINYILIDAELSCDDCIIDAELSCNDCIIDAELSCDDYIIDADFTNVVEVQADPPDPYTGNYTVDLDFYQQILHTNNKLMMDDVTVNAIEIARVSNPQGGRTIYIGGIIDA